MTAFPSNIDSGYCTGIAGSSFSFEEDDIAALSRPCSASEGPKANQPAGAQSQTSQDCVWDLNRSMVFQRRRSASCPAAPVTNCATRAVELSREKLPKRSISCKKESTSSLMDFCVEQTSRTVATQTENAAYCTACDNRISEEDQSPAGPSAPATVIQEDAATLRILDAIANRRCRSLVPFRTGRRLAQMGDEFFAEYMALARREPPANHRQLIEEANEQLLNAVAIGWRFANGAILGAFVAVPLPEIVRETFNYIRDFLTR